MSWRVHADEALDRWEPGQPDERIQGVHEWLLDLAAQGPPAGAISAPWDDDLLVAIVPSTGVVATFLAISQDRYIVVRNFEDL